MSQSELHIEEVTDPRELDQAHRQRERHRRNDEWLQSHWDDLLPQARGKFLAVAGQQAFLAETPADAWSWAETTHPEDDGAFVQFVPKTPGPRIYDCRRNLD